MRARFSDAARPLAMARCSSLDAPDDGGVRESDLTGMGFLVDRGSSSHVLYRMKTSTISRRCL
jgi:hypothetical protein